MKKTTIYLPEDIVIEIKALSVRDRRSEAELIRDALSNYVREQRSHLPAFVGMVHDEGFRGRDDERYLDDHWKPE